MLKRNILSSLPFLISIVIGVCIYLFSTTAQINNDLKSLLINISSALLAIPIVFLFYDLISKFSKRKLQKEIFDYAKMTTDRSILSTLFQLIGILYFVGSSATANP